MNPPPSIWISISTLYINFRTSSLAILYLEFCVIWSKILDETLRFSFVFKHPRRKERNSYVDRISDIIFDTEKSPSERWSRICIFVSLCSIFPASCSFLTRVCTVRSMDKSPFSMIVAAFEFSQFSIFTPACFPFFFSNEPRISPR